MEENKDMGGGVSREDAVEVGIGDPTGVKLPFTNDSKAH